MGQIERRLRVLEGFINPRPCSECGWMPGELPGPGQLVVEWHDDPDDPVYQDPCEEEYCGMCGTQLVYVIRWLDLEEDDNDTT